MATTISRTAYDLLVNDSGGGTDGSIWDKQDVDDILDAIDALIAANIVFGGTVTAAGFGTHTFSAGGTGTNSILIANPTAGTGNFARLSLETNTSPQGHLSAFSTTYTPSGNWDAANSIGLASVAAGGLALVASHASGTVRFFAGGTTEWMRLTVDGGLGLKDGITAPATAAGFAVLYVDTADGDLKVKYGDGTVKTIVVDT